MSDRENHWNNPDRLLESEEELNKLTKAISTRNLETSALNCGGNPLHPNDKVRKKDIERIEKTILLAEKLKVGRIITFSGCPGSSENSKYPN